MRKFHTITIRNERQFNPFTGLSQNAFARPLIEFTHGLEAVRQRRYHQPQDAIPAAWESNPHKR
jgi:hypothetical protein